MTSMHPNLKKQSSSNPKPMFLLPQKLLQKNHPMLIMILTMKKMKKRMKMKTKIDPVHGEMPTTKQRSEKYALCTRRISAHMVLQANSGSMVKPVNILIQENASTSADMATKVDVDARKAVLVPSTILFCANSQCAMENAGNKTAPSPIFAILNDQKMEMTVKSHHSMTDELLARNTNLLLIMIETSLP